MAANVVRSPRWGANSGPPNPLAAFKGSLRDGRGKRGGKGRKGGEGKEEKTWKRWG